MRLLFTALACLLSVSLSAQEFPINNQNQYFQPELPNVPIWSNDCNVDNCNDWVFDNGADIAGSPWEGVDIYFECTTLGPAGPYNQWAGGTGDGNPADQMNSTTASNGTLMVDSDLFGTELGGGGSWIENCWVQTAEPIDCSTEDFVSISLETRYRYWDELSTEPQCFIEISRDGVNWPSIETRDEESGYVIYGTDTVPSRKILFPGFTNTDGTANPSILEFDISAAAGGQETVYIRFRWMGTWGYSWEIDDIQVYPSPENDMRIDNYLSYTDYERTGYYEYGAWPQSQIPNDLQAGAKVYNVGYAEQTGVTLELDNNGVVDSSDAISLTSQQNDTLAVPYQPDGLGDFTLTYNLYADAEDENPNNNTAEQSFTVTDYSFGRDDGFINLASPSDGNLDYLAISLYDIVEDVMIYGIDVAIIEGSEQGSPLAVHLFDGTDPNFLESQFNGILVSSDEIDLNTNYLNTPGEEVQNWYHFVFDEPYEASAGDLIGAGFEHYGGNNVQYGASKYTQDQTAFIYGSFGVGTYDWYYTNNVPMIRLNLDPSATATDNLIGCTDINACNYNSEAEVDDGSCEYESCAGCMDENATNFDPIATIDDGSCESILGCTNYLACNWNPAATLDDSSCTYPEMYYNCNGQCLIDDDNDGICNELEIPGCTNYEADNYDPNATDDDDSCVFFIPLCDTIGDSEWENMDTNIYPSNSSGVFGEYFDVGLALNVNETIFDPMDNQLTISSLSITDVQGLPNGVSITAGSDFNGQLYPISQECLTMYGTPFETGVFMITFNGIAGVTIFGSIIDVEISFIHTLEIGENPNPILGCTYNNATNYNIYATDDDGSCEFYGCMDEMAINYSPLATQDDESCFYEYNSTECLADLNFDNAVTTQDLLILLTEYGQFCE